MRPQLLPKKNNCSVWPFQGRDPMYFCLFEVEGTRTSTKPASTRHDNNVCSILARRKPIQQQHRKREVNAVPRKLLACASLESGIRGSKVYDLYVPAAGSRFPRYDNIKSEINNIHAPQAGSSGSQAGASTLLLHHLPPALSESNQHNTPSLTSWHGARLLESAFLRTSAENCLQNCPHPQPPPSPSSFIPLSGDGDTLLSAGISERPAQPAD